MVPQHMQGEVRRNIKKKSAHLVQCRAPFLNAVEASFDL